MDQILTVFSVVGVYFVGFFMLILFSSWLVNRFTPKKRKRGQITNNQLLKLIGTNYRFSVDYSRRNGVSILVSNKKGHVKELTISPMEVYVAKYDIILTAVGECILEMELEGPQ